MTSNILSCAVLGVEGYVVEVEVDMSAGLPGFTTVVLPEGAVRESKERVRSAIKNSGFRIPPRRITVNLAPANVRKDGSSLDLPISVGMLLAAGLIKPVENTKDFLIVGELSLDGRVKKIGGVLPMVFCTKQKGLKGVVVPAGNAAEASLVSRAPESWSPKFLNGRLSAVRRLNTELTSAKSRDSIKQNAPLRFQRAAGTTSLWSGLRVREKLFLREEYPQYFPT